MKRFWCCSFLSQQEKLWASDWPQPSGSSPSVHFGREQIIATPPAAVDVVHIVLRSILMPLHKYDQLEVGLTCIQSLTCSHVSELSAVSMEGKLVSPQLEAEQPVLNKSAEIWHHKAERADLDSSVLRVCPSFLPNKTKDHKPRGIVYELSYTWKKKQWNQNEPNQTI